MSCKSWFFRIVEFSFIPTLSSLCYWMLCIHPTWMISCFTWRSESGLECQPLAEPQNRSLAGRIGHLGQRKGVQVIRCYDYNCSSLVGTGQWVWLQVQFRRKDVNCRKMDAGNNLSLRNLRFWVFHWFWDIYPPDDIYLCGMLRVDLCSCMYTHVSVNSFFH